MLGLYTHAGQSYKQETTNELLQVVELEQDSLLNFTDALLQKMQFNSEEEKLNFVSSFILSIGSTPSLARYQPSHFKKIDQIQVNEFHPGNYIFYDLTQAHIGSCSIDDCAGFVLASVVCFLFTQFICKLTPCQFSIAIALS